VHRRAAVAEPNPWGVVFTSPLGKLRDPNNTQADLREVFGRLGYGWITSHVFRKTAATAIDNASMSARVIADQLGQAQVSVTQDVYLGCKMASERATRALEVLGLRTLGITSARLSPSRRPCETRAARSANSGVKRRSRGRG
jgi:integrase